MKRRREYFYGRLCAKRCIQQLASNLNGNVDTNVDRSPTWPVGIIGSITHSNNIAMSVCGSSNDWIALGVDIEDVFRPELTLVYWKKLVNEFPYAGIHRNHYSRYFDSPMQTFPLIPTPLSRVKFSQGGQSEADTWSDGLAPLNLSLLIFELDLWWCYKSLLKYFDTLKAHHDNVSWGHFYDSLPEWAWPGRNYNDNFLIILNDENVFDLYLPSSVPKLTFADLDLNE